MASDAPKVINIRARPNGKRFDVVELLCWYPQLRDAEEHARAKGKGAEVRIYDSRGQLLRTFTADP